MIAIKGMKMPKSCAECPMYNSDVDDYCDITGEWITGEEMVRHKNCPLVEIVTCKDCIHRDKYGCRHGHPNCKDNFWCADGKRKSEKDNYCIYLAGEDSNVVDGIPRSDEYFEERIAGNPDFCNG